MTNHLQDCASYRILFTEIVTAALTVIPPTAIAIIHWSTAIPIVLVTWGWPTMAAKAWPTWVPIVAFPTTNSQWWWVCLWWDLFWWVYWWFHGWFHGRFRLLNAFNAVTAFADYLFLDLLGTTAHHFDCHRVVLVIVDLVSYFSCSQKPNSHST